MLLKYWGDGVMMGIVVKHFGFSPLNACMNSSFHGWTASLGAVLGECSKQTTLLLNSYGKRYFFSPSIERTIPYKVLKIVDCKIRGEFEGNRVPVF